MNAIAAGVLFLACATTLDAQAKLTDAQIADKVKSANAKLAAGDVEEAAAECSAAVAAKSDDVAALACATKVLAAQATHRAEQFKLEHARALVAGGDLASARTLLLDVMKSTWPDILESGTALEKTVRDKAEARIDATADAALERARFQIHSGKRDDAAATLQTVIGSDASQVRIGQARDLLKESQTTWALVRDTLRAPWILQTAAAVSIVGLAWMLLHWIRDGYRWAQVQVPIEQRGPSPWMFAGVDDANTLGARGPILDALRRVPADVRQPIVRPARLLLYRTQSEWEIWEDEGLDPRAAPVPAFRESDKVFGFLVQDGNSSDKALADAFQNLQVSVGGASLSGIGGLWVALLAWWQTGSPAISAIAKQDTKPDGSPAELIVRLNASGDNAGTISVMASTQTEDGVDVLALSAERAAYKLLSRLGTHNDTIEQIDGHAAFRQGCKGFMASVRSIVDSDADIAHRTAGMRRAIFNLEFARRTFQVDTDHRVYFLEALRLEGLAYAFLGSEGVALSLLRMLVDETAGSRKTREQQLNVEARYNFALLAWKQCPLRPGVMRAQVLFDGRRFDDVGAADATLKDSTRVWRAVQLASLTRAEWATLDLAKVRQFLTTINVTLTNFTNGIPGWTPRAAGIFAARCQSARAVMQLGVIAAESGRGVSKRSAVPAGKKAEAQAALDTLAASAAAGVFDATMLTTQAYGLLLLSKWSEAERVAARAFADDPRNQFACYIAAEAAFQRGDKPGAKAYVDTFRPSAVGPAPAALPSVIMADPGLIALSELV